MDIFRKAGKKFEETKRAYVDKDPEFVCQVCEEAVSEPFDHCPGCGEPAIEPIEDVE